MPTGTVTRFNDTQGAGYIKAATGGYPVAAEDMDSNAQFEGANVKFDVQRTSDGTRAVNVTLREGTRHSPTQRRFGDNG